MAQTMLNEFRAAKAAVVNNNFLMWCTARLSKRVDDGQSQSWLALMAGPEAPQSDTDIRDSICSHLKELSLPPADGRDAVNAINFVNEALVIRSKLNADPQFAITL